MIFDNSFGENRGMDKSMYIGGDYFFRKRYLEGENGDSQSESKETRKANFENECTETLKKLKIKDNYINMSKLMMLMLGALQKIIKKE